MTAICVNQFLLTSDFLGKSSNFTYDYPYSWSLRPYIPSTDKFKNAKVSLV